MFQGGRIAAETVGKKAGDPANRGYAYAGQIVNAAVREVLLQELNDLPTVDERLQFRRGTKVLEEIPNLVDVLK